MMLKRFTAFALSSVALVLLQAACSPWQQLTRSRTEYESYRQTRVAQNSEKRLRAAWAYLKAGHQGPWRRQTELWFYPTESRFFGAARTSLEGVAHYLSVLPDGPHQAAAKARIVELVSVQAFEVRKNRQRLGRDETVLHALDQAHKDRSTLVQTFSRWVTLGLSLRTWGESTNALPSEFIFAFRLTPPEASCTAELCKKQLILDFSIPERGQASLRKATLAVVLRLSQGVVVGAELRGPQLFSRLSEALTLRAVDAKTGELRRQAIAQALQVVELLIEPFAPQGRCGRPLVGSEVLARVCDGTEIRMVPSLDGTDEDKLVFIPSGDAPPGATP